MQFIDLSKQQQTIRLQIDSAIKGVLDHGCYIMGPEISELEEQLSNFVGIKNCISCSSGTDAILMSLMALGVGPGHAVFVPSFTFIATAEVISLLGATPIFVDIDPESFNLCSQSLEKKIEDSLEAGNSPKVVIAVDMFGLCSDYGKISTICDYHELDLIEDAAQSFGASIGPKKAGSFGGIATTSFFPAKPLGCYGDGGAIFTDNDELAGVLRSIRVHGKGEHKYDNVRVGINGRLDTLQAAILLEKLKIFPQEVVRRNDIGKEYQEKLSGFQIQKIPPGFQSVFAQFSILAESTEHREDCLTVLRKNGIPAAIYYPKPLHLQKVYFGQVAPRQVLSVTEDICSRIFSIPMHPYLTDTEINRICSVLGAV